jgi:predicted enzyme related to lactoylglutathione lyase
MNPHPTASIGKTAWFDLPVKDLADAMAFYQALFQWDYAQMKDSPLSDYVMVKAGGALIGGLRRVSQAVPPAEGTAPILYFTVEKLAPAIARAKELGAETAGAWVDLGVGRGRYQWIRDREGNLIGLWGPE